jgi:hypothetical protein
MKGYVAGSMGKQEIHTEFFVGSPLGRSISIWEDNIKIDLREIGFGGVDWIHVAHDRGHGGSCEHGNEP